jgi:hypothetical protein
MPIPIPVIDGLLGLSTALIDRVFPDKAKADEAKLKVLELHQTGELALLTANTQLALKQGEINVEEAKSEHLFKSGWRPAVGWCCALAFFAKYIGGPGLFVLAQYTGHHVELPPIDMVEMMPVLLGMLGLGALRSYEKKT